MKTKLVNLLFFSLSFSLYQCDNNDIQNSNLPKQINAQENSQNREINARKNAEINLKNEQTWEKVQKLRISDTDFLKTKQPMSDDAIAPYDYHTGLVGDKAYNQVVYLKALERAKKHLSVEKNRLVLMLKKGVEINIAEDLFKYVAGIIDMWNNGIEDGKYRIIKTEQGYYDIFPIFENKSSSRVSAVNLSSMNESTPKSIYCIILLIISELFFYFRIFVSLKSNSIYVCQIIRI